MAHHPLRAAIYTRVSSDEQTRGYGLEYQLEDSKRLLREHGHRLTKVYSDPGISGTIEDRPGLAALREDARSGLFDVLYIWKGDRLSRDELLQLTLYRELRSHGIEVVSVTEPNMNELMRGIYAVFAAEDLRNLKAKMYSGRIRAMRDGKWIGPTPYGYRKDPRTFRLKPHKQEAPWLQRLFHLLVEEEMTITALARRAYTEGIQTRHDLKGTQKPRNGPGFWAKGALRRILTRDYYATGIASFHRRDLPSSGRQSRSTAVEQIAVRIPPLISRELFDAAQLQISKNRRFARRRMKRTYLFAKKLRCGHCQHRLTGNCRRNRPDEKFYRADHWAETLCPHCRYYRERDLEEPIWAALLKLFADPAGFINAVDQYRRTIADHPSLEVEKAKLSELETRLNAAETTLLNYELEGFYGSSVVARKRSELVTQRQELREQRARLDHSLQARHLKEATIASAAKLYERIRPALEDADYEVKRKVIEQLVDEVIVFGDTAEVRLLIPVDDPLSAVVAPQNRKGTVPAANGQDHTSGRMRRKPYMSRVPNDGTPKGSLPVSFRVAVYTVRRRLVTR